MLEPPRHVKAMNNVVVGPPFPHTGCQNLFCLFILKVANIRCVILIKCSEQEARVKKYVIMS